MSFQVGLLICQLVLICNVFESFATDFLVRDRRTLAVNTTCVCAQPGTNNTLPCDAQGHCNPFVTDVNPKHGWILDFTEVTIVGGFLENATTVRFGDSTWQFPILFGNDSFIVCNATFPPGGIPLENRQLFVDFKSGFSFNTSSSLTFSFTDTPTIDGPSISPLRSPLSGGINQTVTGRNLYQDYEPTMYLAWTYTSPPQYTGPNLSWMNCSVINSTTMICPTPTKLSSAVHFVNPNLQRRRRKRDRSQFMNELNRFIDDCSNLTANDGSVTYKQSINYFYPQFCVGFAFSNDHDTLFRAGSVIHMYQSPTVDMFPGDNNIYDFPVYQTAYISIQGNYFTYGARAKDYVIKIGATSLCEGVSVTTYTITCNPPRNQPALNILDMQPTGDYPRGASRVVLTVGSYSATVGFLNYQNSVVETPQFKYGMIGGSCALLVIIIIALSVAIYKKVAPKKDKTADPNIYTPQKLIDRIPAGLRSILRDVEIDELRLIQGEKIGKGHFGEVFEGALNQPIDNNKERVAIKAIKASSTMEDIIEFLEEAVIMKPFNHDNVLSLIGVAFRSDMPLVVLPYMACDLKHHISKPQNTFTVRELLAMARQVTRGMHYLATEQSLVHRDLAARNCLISLEGVVKVSDFGLSRDVYSNDYYLSMQKRRELPFSWMAVECLVDRKFTQKSDVWSFGVLVWELFTFGMLPYADIDPFRLRKFLQDGLRLEKPNAMPYEVYDVLMICWDSNPEDRPTFAELMNEFDSLVGASPPSLQPNVGHPPQQPHSTTPGQLCVNLLDIGISIGPNYSSTDYNPLINEDQLNNMGITAPGRTHNYQGLWSTPSQQQGHVNAGYETPLMAANQPLPKPRNGVSRF